jgi:hypothetical protein
MQIFKMSNTISISIFKFSKYNFDFISTDEVLVLELMLYHYQKNTLNKLVISKMVDEIGMNRSRLSIALSNLEKKRFIKKEVLEFKTIYYLDLQRIIDSLNLLFKKEYRNIYRVFHKINTPQAFRKTAQKQRSKNNYTNKELIKKTRNKANKRNEVPIQISLFDL